MKDILVKIGETVVSDVITFKITFKDKKDLHALEIIAKMESNLSELLISSNENKHICIYKKGSDALIDYTIKEISSLGIKLSDNNEIVSYCNCYGTYVIKK